MGQQLKNSTQKLFRTFYFSFQEVGNTMFVPDHNRHIGWMIMHPWYDWGTSPEFPFWELFFTFSAWDTINKINFLINNKKIANNLLALLSYGGFIFIQRKDSSSWQRYLRTLYCLLLYKLVCLCTFFIFFCSWTLHF